jgi:hypothetical protein
MPLKLDLVSSILVDAFQTHIVDTKNTENVVRFVKFQMQLEPGMFKVSRGHSSHHLSLAKLLWC